MKVLVLGNGAREHALTWKFYASKMLTGLFIAPGNAGTAELGTNLPEVAADNAEQVIAVCKKYKIDLVFVGPEIPLSAGVVDALKKEGIPAVGPTKEAAQLESSKAYSKQFMKKHKIPTAASEEFSSKAKFRKYIESTSGMVVVKKSGLAAGKGVLESDDHEELIAFGEQFLDEDKVIVEEFLKGYEVSIFVLTDGLNYKILPPCTDFKKAGEGNTGPNTGGMGSICPVPWFPASEMMPEIEEKIIKATVNGIKKDRLDYKGVIYIGLMITEKGPYVLEYNVRFGDPECQVLMPLIESDFADLSVAITKQKLGDFPLEISSDSALCVVAAAEGYPGPYDKMIPVTALPNVDESITEVFHASTATNEDGQLCTNGGRCFTISARGKNLLESRTRAYKYIKDVDFKGVWFRGDIGARIFNEELVESK